MLRIEEGKAPYGARIVTALGYKTGDPIHRIERFRLLDKPTYQSIQIGESQHLVEDRLIYLNHSCRPNTLIDTDARTLVAARAITPGEELTFFYPSTEWEMIHPFVCLCGSPDCIRLVAGARYLSLDTLSRYFLNRHVQALGTAALAVGREAGQERSRDASGPVQGA